MTGFLRIILFFFLFYLAYRIIKGLLRLGLGWGRGAPRIPGEERGELVKDPVCGTYLPKEEALSVKAGGETHYFCSLSCRDKFKEER